MRVLRRNRITTAYRSDRARESGQALVEFMLTLLLAISVVTALSFGFRKSLRKFWYTLAREISAPCPKCPPPPGLQRL